MAHLVVRLDADNYFHRPVAGPRMSLGSGGWSEGVHVTVPHPSVAPLHASVEPIEGGFKLVDHSGGRTFARGRPICGEITLIGELDLRLGDVWVTFHEDGPEREPGTVHDREEEELTGPLRLVVGEPGRGPARRVPLDHELTIGSSADCDVRLPHPTVSGRHARLVRERTRLRLYDEKSRNGTITPGGVGIDGATLPLGTTFRVGPFELRVEGEGEPASALEELYGIFTADENVKGLFPVIGAIAEKSDRPVVIRGETGTGKDLVARAIHALGPRAGGPYVAVNCASFTGDLVESELFGSEKGAFTGAVERDGLFVQADGGILFLDEVGELPPAAQAKLLRALQDGEVRRVGGMKLRRVDVRVVAATHEDLKAEAEAGRFRFDLYWRLAAQEVKLPPLRHRGEDVVLLFERLIRQGRPGCWVPPVSQAAKARLRAHPWPGNFRELQNVVDRALVRLGSARAIGPELLDLEEPKAGPPPGEAEVIRPRGKRLDEIEKEAIALAMRHHSGNRKAAVEQLGISPTTLLKKLREYGLEEVGRGLREGP